MKCDGNNHESIKYGFVRNILSFVIVEFRNKVFRKRFVQDNERPSLLNTQTTMTVWFGHNRKMSKEDFLICLSSIILAKPSFILRSSNKSRFLWSRARDSCNHSKLSYIHYGSCVQSIILYLRPLSAGHFF